MRYIENQEISSDEPDEVCASINKLIITIKLLKWQLFFINHYG